MKKTNILLLLFLITFYCYGQNTTEEEKIINLVKKCYCSNQIINSDSIYSFFQSKPLKPLDNKSVDRYFVVEDEPMSNEKVINKIKSSFHMDMLIHFSRMGYSSNNGSIPALKVEKMVSAILDSTTRYTYPIKKWNCAELGEKWMTKSNHIYHNQIVDNRVKRKFLEKRKKRDTEGYSEFMGTYLDASFPTYIEMSLPVFDSEYNYALLIFKIEGSKNNSSFAIFQRKEQGWTPLYVFSNLYKNSFNDDFRSY